MNFALMEVMMKSPTLIGMNDIQKKPVSMNHLYSDDDEPNNMVDEDSFSNNSSDGLAEDSLDGNTAGESGQTETGEFDIIIYATHLH